MDTKLSLLSTDHALNMESEPYLQNMTLIPLVYS